MAKKKPAGCRQGRLGALRLIRETESDPPTHTAQRTPCRSPRDAFLFMQPHVEREEAETFWILALDIHSNILFGNPIVITRGTLNSSLIHPREVFRAAIVAGAAAVILVHNHPSGDPAPSPDDRAITRQLVEAARLLDLPIQDHIIIGGSAYRSFVEMGLL